MALFDDLIQMEDYAVFRKPKMGKCPKSPFMNEWHRVGVIPTISHFDNGLPGDVLSDICLHCSRVFGHDGFLPRKQPNRIGG